MHENMCFSKSSTTLVIVCFLITAILVGMKWYHIVVLIHISLITNEAEHIFMYLLAFNIFSLEKCLFKSFADFWMGLSVLLLSCKGSLCIFHMNSLYVYANIVSHSVVSLCIFLKVSFGAKKFLILWCLVYFFLLSFVLLVSCLRNYCLIQAHKDLCLCFGAKVFQSV